MRYRVLSGGVELLDGNGEAIPLGGGRPSALLAILVARARQVVSTDELADLLWGDAPPENPGNAIQVLVSRIRTRARSAGIDLTELATRNQGYVLDVEPAQIDAGRFELLVQSAKDSDTQIRVTRLREALSLWRGRPYGESSDSDIARLEALRLDEMRRGAEVELGAALIVADRADEALAVLEPYVARHELDERARAELMRALYSKGRHAEALNVFRQYERVLADELGLEPSASLRELELEILSHDVGGDVSKASDRASSPFASLSVRYLRTGDGAVAWTKAGTGPRLVAVPAWVTSLEVMASGRDPRSTILERLADSTELVLYDRRGTGLSEGPVDDFSVDAARRELEAVVEESGGPAALLAMSQAGPTALRLAATRPDLITHLILFGTFASGPDTFASAEVASAILDVVRSHWGIGSRLFASLYRPDASDAAAEHLGRVLRDSAPREVAVGYLETVYTTDVTDVLAQLDCPTLVLHYRGDRVIPFSGGQQLATGVPGAEFVVLEGNYHLPDASDLDVIIPAIDGFLAR